ncbi:hypothetical protein DL95DRAFT_454959 [Leptodontidium sp. 2 PMI_412]|nr:hypothetical protein DL95DRAFT_454959 [Leptodontidium sp. 2 PMI_412]
MAEEEQCSKCKMFPVEANNQQSPPGTLPPVSQPTTAPTILRHVWKPVGTILKDRTSIITVNSKGK